MQVSQRFCEIHKGQPLETNLLCMEFVAGCCRAVVSGGFLFMPGGGPIPEPTWGGMLPMLGGMFGPMLGPILGP